MTTADDTRRRPWLAPRARKWILVLHVVSAVGWLGINFADGTQWGLLRYKWVVVKLILTTIAVLLIPVALLPELNDLATALPADELLDTSEHVWGVLSAAVVSTSMYITNVIMSVVKPGGRTQRGERARQSAQPGRTSPVS